jgi:alcohol dehydrogenase (cytochrome c)
MMRSISFAVLLSAALPIAALAQTADDLKNDVKTPGDVLVYGMGYSAQRFSPLTQINKDNVGRLVPIWAYSLADLQGGEAFPIIPTRYRIGRPKLA